MNWWYLLYLIPAALVVLIAVVLVRTARFVPPQKKEYPAAPVTVDADAAVDHLSQMIRCKTVSDTDWSKVDEGEFEKFRDLLRELYPNVWAAAEYRRVGPTGMLFHIKGEKSDAPSVFMSHYDVVPINEEGWTKPAFEGLIADGCLWGRGTLDTKGTLLGVMESGEALLKAGFVPKNDIYFSFSGDEEIAGPSAPAAVEYLESCGVRPAFVLDEGGAVVEGVFPGVSAPCALVGTGEKGIMDLEFSAKSNGGHASAPPPHTLVGKLSAACVAVEKDPFPARLTAPVAEMYDTLGRHSGFVYRMIFSNLWLFSGVLDKICKKSGGEMNALMRTTVAFTQMKGSEGMNILPPAASMVANLRLMGGDTRQTAVERLKKIIGDDTVSLRIIDGSDPSPFSQTKGEAWERLRCAIGQTWPEALISPYLMIAASDSRRFCKISDNVYRFSAMALSKEERGFIHANDERIPLEKIETTVAFYLRLMGNC